MNGILHSSINIFPQNSGATLTGILRYKKRVNVLRIAIIIFLFIGFSLKGFAHHLKGGWIYYEYLGAGSQPNTSKYKITVKQYLECGSTAGQIDANIYLGIFDGTADTLVKTLTIALTGTDIENKVNYGCTNPNVHVCYRVDRYETIQEFPNNTGGYILSVQRCCRIDGIINVAASDSAGLTYTNKLPGIINGVSYRNNNSPIFAQKDTAVVCQNNFFTFDFSATDADGDVLKYAFTYGLKGGDQTLPGTQPNPPTQPGPPYDSTVSINYASGFSALSPMGPGVKIDSTTGLISGIAPNATGDYVIAVAVSEYRNNVLIGISRKELHINVAVCTVLYAITSQVNVQCLSGPTGSATASASGGVGPYSYTWSTTPVQLTATASGLTAGTYTVSIHDANLCTTSKTVTIVPVPNVPTAGNNGPLCVGGTLNLTASTITGTTYSWVGPNGFTSTAQNPVITNVTTANAGVYSVSAIANNCGGASSSTTVVINPLPATPSASSNSPLCVGSTLTLSAATITGATYFWSGPNGFSSSLQNPTISNVTSLNAGNYSVYVSVNGCAGPASTIAVVMNTIPSVPVGSSNSPVCAGSTLLLTANNISGATYNWSGPNTFSSTSQNPSVANTTSADGGIYKVWVTVGGCVSAKTSVIVAIQSLPATPTPSNNGPLCAGATLNVNATSVLGATYSWTGPNSFTSSSRNNSIANASAANSGVYSIRSFANGCYSIPTTTTAVINVVPIGAATSNSPLCVGSTLNLSTTAYTGATYFWTGPNGYTSASQNPVILNASTIASGNYSVITSANGCTAPASSTAVIVNPIPSTPIATSNSPICSGSSINLFASTVAGATYLWSGPNGFSSNLQNPVITNASAINQGNYSVVSVVNGCSSTVSSVFVTVNNIPATPVANNNGPLCSGATLNLSTNSVVGALYQWNGPNSFSSTSQNPQILNSTSLNQGTYTLKTTVNGCISAAGTTSVVINSIPAAPIISSNSPICEGNALNLVSNSITGATYYWSGPNGFTSNLQNPIINNASILSAGNYLLTITVNGCTGPGASLSVTVNPLPAKAIIGNNGPVCEGSTLNLSASNVSGATYLWTGPNGFTSNQQNPVILNSSSLNAGNYSLSTYLNSCGSGSATTSVVIKSLPAQSYASNNGPLCVGASLNLFATSVLGVTYNWTGPNGFTSSLQNPVLNNVRAIDSGSYILFTSANGCSSNSSKTIVKINTLPAADSISSNGPLCAGQQLNLFAASVSGASYSWTGPNGFLSSVQNPSIPNVSSVNAGIYNLFVTTNGCAGPSSQTNVIINPLPGTPVVSNNGPVCEGGSANLFASTIAGATYTWTGPNGFVSNVQNPILPAVNLSNAGIYSVYATQNGCAGNSASTTLQVKPLPLNGTLSSNSPVCFGGDILLHSTTVAGASYNWTGPNGFVSNLQHPIIAAATSLQSGTYYCQVSINGCESLPDSIIVFVKSEIAKAVVSNNGPLCEGTDLQLTASNVSGATYSWTGPSSFSSNLQNPFINNVTLSNGGTYNLNITVDGCTTENVSTKVIIKSNPLPATITNNGPLCEGGTLNLSATTVSGASYNWTGPNGFLSTSQNPAKNNIALLDSGDYKLIVQVNGCYSTSSTTHLTVNSVPAIPTISNNGPLCEGADLHLSTDATGNISYSWGGPNGFNSVLPNPKKLNIDVTDSGVYSLSISSNGCTSGTATAVLVVHPIPVAPVVSNDGPYCEGVTINLKASPFSGASYVWSGPNGFTSNLQNPVKVNAGILDSGIYQAYIIVDGCSSTISNTLVVVNPIPSKPAISSNSPVCAGSDLKLFASNISSGSYNWSGPNGFNSTAQNPVINTSNALNSGTYFLVIKSAGCSSDTTSISVIVNPIPQGSVPSNNGPLCVGSNLQLSASTITSANYNWSGPNGFSSHLQNPIINSITSFNAGVYTLLTSLNGCTGLEQSTTVVVNAIPQSALASNNGPICEGSTLQLSSTTISGANYIWSGPNGFTSTLQNPIITNAAVVNAGSYNVITSINGCMSERSNTDVLVHAIPPSPVIYSNSPVCQGSNIRLNADSVAGVSYSWVGPNGFTSVLQNPIINNAEVINSGTYILTTSINGCSGTPSTLEVLVNDLPQSPTALNNGPVCAGSLLQLSASFIQGASYSWTGPNGFVSSEQEPLLNNVSLINAGVYWVVASLNGCNSVPSQTNVVVNPLPDSTSASNNGPVCVGNLLQLSASSIANVTYLWEGPNGFTSSLQNPSLNSVNQNNAGVYKVKTISNKGCQSNTSETNVLINSLPDASNASNNGPLCVGSNLQLSASTVSGASYSWSGPNGFISSEQNPVINNINLLHGGTYSVVTSANGCSGLASQTDVVVNVIPTGSTASNNGPLCVGSDLQLSASSVSGATYLWTGPNGFTSSQQNPSISNVTLLNAGSYSLTTFVNGCSSVPSITDVVVNSIPQSAIASSNSPVCSGSTLELSATTVANANYSWRGPNGFTSLEQNPKIDNVTLINSGSYILTTSLNGCLSLPSQVDVIVNPLPETPVVLNNGPLCVGTTLQLSASLINGATYSWTGPNGFVSSQKDPVINNVSTVNAGDYFVRTTINGCSSNSVFTNVIVNILPESAIASNNGPVCLGTTLQLSATTIAGASYSWIGPNGFTSFEQNPLLNNVGLINAGSYTVTTSSNGCQSVPSSTSVIVNSLPESAIASSNSPICEGSTVQLSASNVSGVSYSWTGPNGFTSSLQNPSINNATSLNAGVYTLTTSSNGCGGLPVTTTVIINPLPQTAVASNNGPLCVGSALQLSGTTVSGAGYLWTGPNGFTSNEQNPIITNISAINGGTYTLVTTSNGCSGQATSTNVIVNAIPESATASGNGPLCEGSNLQLSASTISGATYSWTGPNGFTSNEQNPTINNATKLNSGIYSVTTFVNGCSSQGSTTSIIINEIPERAITTNNGPLCVGSVLQLSASNVSGASYSWTGPNGFISSAQNPVINNISLLQAGTYSVVTSASGCSALSFSTNVVVNEIPTGAIASNNGPLCVGTTLQLSASQVSGASYLWAGPNGYTSSQQNPSISNVTLLNAGSYSLITFVNGCSSVPSVTDVVVNPIPESAIASSNSPLCVGTTLQLSATTIAGASYSWIGPNGFTSFEQNPVLNNVGLINAGSYTVTTSSNGCQSVPSSTSVIVNALPESSIASSNSPVCEGSTVQLSASYVSGVSYSWTGPNGFTSSLQNPSINNATSLNAGVYTLTTSSNGCGGLPVTITVIINPLPQTAVASNNGPLCVGSALQLSATTVSGAGYLWTGPNGFTSTEQNPIITNIGAINAGTYTLVTTSNGCSGQATSTNVIINAIPESAIASGNGPLCEGSTLQLSASTISGATYSWTGPNGFSSNEQNPTINNITTSQAGQYVVTTYKNSCGSLPSSINIIVNSLPASPILSSNSPVCTGSFISLFANVDPGGRYLWKGPNGFSSVQKNIKILNASIINSGNYLFTYSLNGCTSKEANIDVQVTPIPTASIISNNGPLCIGSTLQLSATASTGNNYNWTGPNGFTSTLQNPVINNVGLNNAGVYHLTNSINNCLSNDVTTIVTIKPLMASAAISSNSPICSGSVLKLTASNVFGATYSWSGPNGFTSNLQNPIIDSVSIVNAGSYSLIVTGNGCSSSESSITVLVKDVLPPIIVSSNSPICSGSDLTLIASFNAGMSYSWTGPNGFSSTLQNPVIKNVSTINSGAYILTGSSNGCNSPSTSVAVTVNSTPAQPVILSNAPLCESASLSLTTDKIASGNYVWSGPNGFNSNLQNPVIKNVSKINEGVYTLITSDNNCSSKPVTTNVIVNPIPSAPVISNNGPLCEGANLTLNVNTGGGRYLWTGPKNFTSILQSPVIKNVDTSNAGVYKVAYSVNGCYAPEASTNVIVRGKIKDVLVNSNSPLCDSSTLQLHASSITGAQYLWSGPGGFSSSLQDPSINNATFKNSGVYTLSVIVDGCNSNATSTNVNIKPATPLGNPKNNGPLCIGTTLNLLADYIPQATYSWTGPGNFKSAIQNPIISNVNQFQAGNYFVKIIQDGCESKIQSTDVVINPKLNLPPANANGPLCEGSTLKLISVTATNATYLWKGPNNFTSTEQNPIIPNVSQKHNGVYTLVLSVAGCSSPESSVNVVVNSIPATPSITSNSPVCLAAQLKFSTDNLQNTSFDWQDPNGNITHDPSLIINNSSKLNEGRYSLTVSQYGCKSPVAFINAIVNVPPPAPSFSSNDPLCAGSDLILNTNEIPNVIYNWTGPNNFVSNERNPVIKTASTNNSGHYKLQLSLNACAGAITDKLISVKSLPDQPAITNNGALCEGKQIILSATADSSATYFWTGPNGFLSSSKNPSIQNAQQTNGGRYFLKVSKDGCLSNVAYTDVKIKSIPKAPIISSNSPLCEGGVLKLMGSPTDSVSYNWVGPNNFVSNALYPVIDPVNLNNSGVYTANVIKDGCVSLPTSINIRIMPATPAVAISNNGPICSGADLILNPVINNNGGNSNPMVYNWTGPNGFKSNLPAPIIHNASSAFSGTYKLSISRNGCEGKSSATDVVIKDHVQLTAGADQTFCNNAGIINLSGSVNQGNSILWKTTGTGTFSPDNKTINALYILSAQDKNMSQIQFSLRSADSSICPSTSAAIKVNFMKSAIVNAGEYKSICDNIDSISLSGSSNSNNITWSTSGDGTFYPDNKNINATYLPGSRDKKNMIIHLKINSSNAQGCPAVSDTTTIVLRRSPTIKMPSDQEIFFNEYVTLHPVVTGNINSYKWNPALYLNRDDINDPVLLGKADQRYNFKVTEVNGCTSNADVNVKVLMPLKIPNTFTPNGDGINDRWNIESLYQYANCRVQVFNRYGQLVFESHGYEQGWDGKFKGQVLPFGTYYYIIEIGHGKPGVTGYVTIVK